MMSPTDPDPGQTDTPLEDYQSVLAAVTGTMIDLKKAAAPPGGWLQLVGPGGGNWMTVATSEGPVFSVSLDDAAVKT